MKIDIREETSADYSAIVRVNDLAFGQMNEGLLVEKLRQNPKFIKQLSILAVMDNKVVGHILFFPIVIAIQKQILRNVDF